MKFVELSEAEVEVLKEMLLMAVWNGNHVTKETFDPTPEQYKIIGRLYNKID